ncbi:hypothetical protein BDP27DRAFT_289681 [Rhodocollybia butyracea]|uniref:DUF6532 domain-containing protein n=1 Tax=Rhodocollybia butyracea TaxID=206335 RepID=A0A9P5PI65_9AGAR|nr:hypothetical protein BDP27DRAFT_289681 [Rhodocollybia butyracea]
MHSPLMGISTSLALCRILPWMTRMDHYELCSRGIFTGFISCARQFVPSRFGLPGTLTAAEVKDLVAWLSHDGRFKYGEVDIQNRSYNTKLPFGCEGIAHIL